MSPASGQNAQIHHDRPYSFHGRIPRELDSALALALSTLPKDGSDVDGPGRTRVDPRGAAIVADVVEAVAKFTFGMKTEGEPPEHVVIALKTALRQHTSRSSPDGPLFEKMQRLLVSSALDAYFAPSDGASAGRESHAESR